MRADARANRTAILTSAAEQMAAHGKDISLTTVADQAGVGIATLYRNFPTRDDLIRAVLDDLEQRTRAILDRAAAQIDVDPERSWTGFVHEIAALRPGALVAAFAATFVSGDELPQQIAEHRARLLNAIQSILDRAGVAGLVRADVTAARFQMGTAAITRPFPGVAYAEPDEQESWMVDVFIRGLRP